MPLSLTALTVAQLAERQLELVSVLGLNEPAQEDRIRRELADIRAELDSRRPGPLQERIGPGPAWVERILEEMNSPKAWANRTRMAAE